MTSIRVQGRTGLVGQSGHKVCVCEREKVRPITICGKPESNSPFAPAFAVVARAEPGEYEAAAQRKPLHGLEKVNNKSN